MNGVELRDITAAFERVVRLVLGLDDETPVKVVLARGDNGIRLDGLSIRGERVNDEDWATLVSLQLVQDMSVVARA